MTFQDDQLKVSRQAFVENYLHLHLCKISTYLQTFFFAKGFSRWVAQTQVLDTIQAIPIFLLTSQIGCHPGVAQTGPL